MSGLATAAVMLAAEVTVAQGNVFRVEVPSELGLTEVTAEWREQTIPLVRDGNWTTVLGVDLDDALGE